MSKFKSSKNPSNSVLAPNYHLLFQQAYELSGSAIDAEGLMQKLLTELNNRERAVKIASLHAAR